MRQDEGDEAESIVGGEARVFELGEAYLDQLHAGNAPAVTSIIESHPDLVPSLERHLALVELLFGARIF